MQAELDKLNANLKITSAAINRVRYNSKRAARKAAQAAAAPLPKTIENVALLVYFLASYNPEPASLFLARAFKRKYRDDSEQPPWERRVEDLFLECDEHQLAQDADKNVTPVPDTLKKAQAFLKEWNMFRYVRRQNLQQGVAPTTQMLLERKHYEEWGTGRGMDEPMTHHAGHEKGRVWAAKWRRRWNVRVKTLRAMEDISLEDKRKNIAFACKPTP